MCCMQAIFSHLECHDFASLRRVSRSICKETTRLVPFITLLLSQSSSAQQLTQWFQATKRFQHVSSVHIHLDQRVSASLFEQAMQQLSEERPDITELHLQAVAYCSPSTRRKAWLTTMQPLRYLLPRLKTLVLEGVAISMPYGIYQLAAAAPAMGWQLQRLVISTLQWCHKRDIHWTELLPALQRLTEAFPNLKQLQLQLPEVDCQSEAYATVYDDKAAAAANILPGDVYEARIGGWPYDLVGNYVEGDLAEVAVVAAVANAVMRLKHLKCLTLSKIPDIWRRTPNSHTDDDGSPAAVTTARESTAEESASVDVRLNGGILPSVAAAAAVFDTLDHCGCWLLQQHLSLGSLCIATNETGWEMSWWRQSQRFTPDRDTTGIISDSSSRVTVQSSSSTAAATLLSGSTPMGRVNLATYDYTWAHKGREKMANTSSTDGSINNSVKSLCASFMSRLAVYSFRPASFLMYHINTCKLELLAEDTNSLADLLAHMKCLKRFEVRTIPQGDSEFVAHFSPIHLTQRWQLASCYADSRSST